MAKVTQSVQYAEQLAAKANFADRIDDSRWLDGPVEYAFIDFTITTDNVQGDVISLVELPVGVIVIPELSKVFVTDDMSSGAVTLDIGDAVDPDRYADGINAASVGTIEFFQTSAIPDGYTNRFKVTEATKVVTLTFATLASTIEAGGGRVLLAYKSL